jgi:hypothetical protein
MMIPANETSLSGLGWKNGSLDTCSYNEWSPAGNLSQPVNLTILSDEIAAIQFLVQGNGASYQNFDARFALVRTVLSSNYNSGSIRCAYPISGSYGYLTRVLFYMLLIFALLYRRHTWVAVAALGTAMTYSATTAVHALALLTQYGWTNGRANVQSAKEFGDVDLYGTIPILLTASVVFTPILNWSKNVRRDKAQIVVVLWGILCFVPLIPAVVYNSSTKDHIALHAWTPNFIPALMLCPRTAAETNPICVMPMNITLESYKACQCFDFCGLLAPAAPMRSGSLSAVLPRKIVFDAFYNKAYTEYEYWSNAFSTIVVCYGGIGLMHSYFTLREMRNLIFRVVCTPFKDSKVIWNLSRNKANVSKLTDCTRRNSNIGSRRVRFIFAKSLATSYYLLGVLVAIFCPLIFVAVIFNMEAVLMNQFTYSEKSNAVGAWSTWVGVAFILLVVVVLRYQERWEAFLLRSGKRVLLLLGFDGLTQPGSEKEKDRPESGFSFAQFGSHILRCSIGGAYSSVKLAGLEFGDWIKAPEPHSPICSCEGCTSHRKLTRDVPTVRDHADNCPCNDCESFRRETRNASKKHNSICGCLHCQSARDQIQYERRDTDRHGCSNCARKYAELNKAEPIPAGYRTLGMRILRSFDRHLLDLLEKADNTFAMVPLTPVQRVDTTTRFESDIEAIVPHAPLQRVNTTTSADSIRTSDSSPASSIDSHEPGLA